MNRWHGLNRELELSTNDEVASRRTARGRPGRGARQESRRRPMPSPPAKRRHRWRRAWQWPWAVPIDRPSLEPDDASGDERPSIESLAPADIP